MQQLAGGMMIGAWDTTTCAAFGGETDADPCESLYCLAYVMGSNPPDGNRNRAHLVRAIAEQEARLAQLRADQQRIEETLVRLQAELAEAERGAVEERRPATIREARADYAAGPNSPSDKIALFRSLFRGREDVYPKLWESKKTGRKGYTPACANEWVTGLCDKRRVKCGQCPNRDLLPVTDQVVRDHLQGRHVIGVYPMLPDETCWFLAADFDKTSWEEDTAAFGETCSSLGVPVAIERSRSGNGAHVWFYFSEPVPAREARRMGCYLLTETMERRHQLGLESYDRLFPNQDTMPQGGFGNLIALPLQYGPRQTGNSVFLDERLLGEAHARFITGLTATPRRRDGHHPITEMQLGPVRYTVDQRKLAASRPFEQKLVLRHTEFRYETEQERPPIQDVYRAMVDDPGRNQMLLDDIIRALERGRSPIVLTERTAHLEFLREQLHGFARNTIVLRGGRTSKQLRVAIEELAAVPDDEERLILATGRFIGEGFDDDRLDTLFLVMPISWKGTLIQYTGRLHRLHPAKREVRIYDYVDRHVPMLARMADKRLRGYRSIGYEVVEGASESVGERPVPKVDADEPFEGDAVIEWDLEAMRTLEWDE